MKEKDLTVQDSIIQAENANPLTDQVVNWDDTDGHERYEDVYVTHEADQIVDFDKEGQQYTFHCANKLAIRLNVLTDRIVRVRYAIAGRFERDFSYAIEADFYKNKSQPTVLFQEEKDLFSLTTKELIINISKSGLVSFWNLQGKEILEEEKGFLAKETIMEGMNYVSVTKTSPSSEAFFGMGDKSCALNLRGQVAENWNTDSFAYEDTAGPLYRTIPFYYGLNERMAYGIFMDNPYRSFFDFDSKNEEQVTFHTEGGEMNYYFIYGPQLAEVATQYTQLTGTAELAPMWALGYHQCRWSYYPEARVTELAKNFRDKQIPCDAIYLDIDYMQGYRCFTWNNTHFPDPVAMISDLKDDGFQTVVMIDPGIKEDEDYFVYQQGTKQDYFCRRTNGQTMVGPVWPQQCVFPDFTSAEVRAWWGNLYKDLYKNDDVAGFWNDMNEPAVFKINRKTFPDSVLHDYDGEMTNHKKAHNIYGVNMVRASYEGLKSLKPNKRPFLLVRASYSGGQRYSAAWTGDNVASWEHLKIANRQCQRMSISGFSFIGTDIGGFVDEPSPELFARWMQLGVFHPVMRVHSMGNNEDGAAEIDENNVKAQEANNRMDQEPWSFGAECTAISKSAIELRYQLLPLLYTAFQQYSLHGTPILQPLSFYDQADANCLINENEFIFGDNLLVAPVVEEGISELAIYLPKGTWIDYWTGETYKGQQSINYAVSLAQIPIFIKEGGVIPHYPVIQHTQARADVEQVTLKVAFGTATSHYYEDAGEGYAYEQGKYLMRTFETATATDSFTIKHTQEGKFRNKVSSFAIEAAGLPFEVQSVKIDGYDLAFSIDGNLLRLECGVDFGEIVFFRKG